MRQDARVHCEVLKIRAGTHLYRRLPHMCGGSSRCGPNQRVLIVKVGYPIPQDPTVCLRFCALISVFHSPIGVVLANLCAPLNGRCSMLMSNPRGTYVLDGALDALVAHQMLLRKEVIQPHLPVRLPCYDFVPIASPTFDGSSPCGLGHRLRVLPTFVT